MKKFISVLASSLVLLFATSAANAAEITGTINFTGSGTIGYNAAETEVSSLLFTGATVSTDAALVTEDFASLAGLAATFNDILDTSAVSGDTLWTVSVGNFAFTMSNITTNIVADLGSLTVATIGGAGTITADGFDTTSGEWTITTNGASSAVSFSSTAVPSPAGAALLGLGLLGFGFSRRNKKA